MISKSEERRNQILVGAFKLFLEKEYADVTTADLEEIAGNKQSRYRYYENERFVSVEVFRDFKSTFRF